MGNTAAVKRGHPPHRTQDIPTDPQRPPLTRALSRGAAAAGPALPASHRTARLRKSGQTPRQEGSAEQQGHRDQGQEPLGEQPLTQRRTGTQGTSQGAPLPTGQQLSLTSLALLLTLVLGMCDLCSNLNL